MKREQQKKINDLAYLIFDDAMNELRRSGYPQAWSKLRTCNACVFETENYYILRSYNTIVACIDKRTDTLVDVLRTEYGYTSTSAQHISKFDKDYCKGYWGCETSLRTHYVR